MFPQENAIKCVKANNHEEKSKSILDMKRLPVKVLLTAKKRSNLFIQIGVQMIYYNVQAEVKVPNL